MPFSRKEKKEKKEEKKERRTFGASISSSSEKSITPKKDFRLFVPNAKEPSKTVDLQLKEGVEISVPSRFLDGLRREDVL